MEKHTVTIRPATARILIDTSGSGKGGGAAIF